jgi:dihydroorotate dehydrogenase (fumarate)
MTTANLNGSSVGGGTDYARQIQPAGADVTMLCSTLLRHGIPQIALIERDLKAWLEEHEYESVQQLKGSLSQKNCAEPAAFERAQYMKALTGYTISHH